MLDLIEVKPKLNKKRVMFCLLLILFFVSFIAFWIVLGVKNHQEIKRVSEICKTKENIKHVITFTNPQIIVNDKVKEEIKNIYHSEQKRAFLTFDDGPSKQVTPLLLDLLKQENIKASFFVLGSRVEFYPEIVKRAYEEGHFIGNHGYSHKYSQIYQSPQAVLDEYNMTEQLVQNAIGNPSYQSHLMRLPGGTVGGKYNDLKAQAVTLLDQNNICHVDWNALTSDSAGSKTKEAMLESVKATIGNKNSVVILMHDAGDKILTYEILPELIQYLRDNGYQFMSFYDIMEE